MPAPRPIVPSSHRLLVCLLALLAPASLPAQSPGPFDGLRFRNIGPATPSGRIDDFAVLESNPAVYYVASATGGLWKTVNNGTTFDPVFDHQGSSSIGDVAIAVTDANLVWVGTGENNNRQSSSWGDGMYKSADGGKTWANMGLRQSKQIARILVDPVDNDVVYVAALGDLWRAGGQRGVYKTGDGGLTWTQVLDGGPDAGATELVMDPANNKVLYAALYQRRRSVWGMNGGGPRSGLWKSTDAGRTWTALTEGLPAGPKGRIGLDVFRGNPNILYARIEHPTAGGVYRSDDAGAAWRKVSATNPRPMYFSQIRVDPRNENRVYVLGTQLHLSDDGGKTWNNDGARLIHVDFHAMWINPANPDHLMIGGDGGVGVSYDRSRTYVWLNNLPVGQFYHVSYDLGNPYTVCGGLQDNNTWCGPSAVRSRDGIANDEWFVVSGGDGFVSLLDPTDPRIIYAESQNGNINRVDRATNERQAIRPEPARPDPELRWNWDTPMQLSPHDPATLYAGAQQLLRSTDRGHTWTAISPDLTLGLDRDTLELMGVKSRDFTIARNDGVSAYGTLFTIAESRLEPGVIWTGSDDGQVQLTRDGGKTWSNVTAKIPGAPKLAYVSKVEPSKFARGAVYLTFDGHSLGDYGTYVYLSPDYGSTWRPIAGGLPAGQVARTITEDLVNPDVLYLGTEAGLWVTLDRGRGWSRVKANLPTVPIYEITLHPRENDMLLATHGRVVWILDDLTPFQQYGPVAAASAALLPAPAATQWSLAGDRSREFEGDRRFLGPNPTYGASFTYYLKTSADSVRLVIRDAQGGGVRELKGDDLKGRLQAGLNTVTWDLTFDPLPAPKTGGGGGFFGPGLDGPPVLPGDYRASLYVNGKEAGSSPVTVLGDPAITISDADRRARLDLLRELHALQGQVNAAADAATSVNDRFTAIRQALEDTAKVPPPFRVALDSLGASLDPIRTRLGLAGGGGGGGGGFGALRRSLRFRVSFLKRAITGATARPTATQLQQAADVRTDVPGLVAEVNALVPRLAALTSRLAEAGLYP